MKASKKQITISINFESGYDLRDALEKIATEVHNGAHKNKNCIFEYEITSKEHPLEHARIEIVNGQECWIIPSSMNSNQ